MLQRDASAATDAIAALNCAAVDVPPVETVAGAVYVTG
jgi:hypothetical protein